MTDEIYPLPCPGAGRLWIMPCPQDADAFAEMAALGVTHVLSMLPPAEAEALGMGQEAAFCAAHGIGFSNAPIADFGLPDRAAFAALIARIMTLLSAGEGLAVHCRAGIGRSGMVTAAALVALGFEADQAQAAFIAGFRYP